MAKEFDDRVLEATLKMPTALKDILDSELAGGNEVAELESGNKPGSVSLRLYYPFRALPLKLPPGVLYCERTDSDPMVFQCSTDDGLWPIRFAKLKPFPLPSLPEGPDPRFAHVAAMEMVQARESDRAIKDVPVQIAVTKDNNDAPKQSPEGASSMPHAPHQFTDQFEIEVDFRGETLSYSEGGRSTQMMWMWTSGYTVYADTIGPWRDADGSTTPLSDVERATLLQRVVKYALDKQGVKMKVE